LGGRICSFSSGFVAGMVIVDIWWNNVFPICNQERCNYASLSRVSGLSTSSGSKVYYNCAFLGVYVRVLVPDADGRKANTSLDTLILSLTT
jgi:hypothetical protein